jgi:hypothetical protein
LDTVVEKAVLVRKYGGTYKESIGEVPRSLDDFIRVLQETRLEILPEHRADAYVDIEPDREYGDAYETLIIGYRRALTKEELVEVEAERRAHCETQLANAEQRIAYCREQLAAQPAEA